MKKILLDTSVYGRLVLDKEFSSVLLEKKRNIEFIFYGNSVIRNELRATPEQVTILKRKLRTYLLETYDSLITKENHNLLINVFVQQLAKMYYDEYRKKGGNVGEINVHNDFLIVASASIYQMDILVSDDRRTLLSDAAVEAYSLINQKQGFRIPTYLDYDHFRRSIFTRCDT